MTRFGRSDAQSRTSRQSGACKHAPYLLAICLVFASPVGAVQPDEMLADAGLEARARAISLDIRCPVCQGENIDDSSAPISRDLRLIIRERLVAGDSDVQVVDFIVARYGEFVLFNPRAEGSNLILWLAGPMLVLAGVGVALTTRRRRGEVAALSEAEVTRLDDIMRQ